VGEVGPSGPYAEDNGCCLARTARESPTFAQNILFPTISTVTHVEPLKYISIPES
jgi:hypothetical protein